MEESSTPLLFLGKMNILKHLFYLLAVYIYRGTHIFVSLFSCKCLSIIETSEINIKLWESLYSRVNLAFCLLFSRNSHHTESLQSFKLHWQSGCNFASKSVQPTFGLFQRQQRLSCNEGPTDTPYTSIFQFWAYQ